MFEQEVIANTVAHMWDTFQPTLITAIVPLGQSLLVLPIYP